MKTDEKELLEELKKRSAETQFPVSVRSIIRDQAMNEKRAAYILEKWGAKGWYNYGVSVFAGWLTDEGKAI